MCIYICIFHFAPLLSNSSLKSLPLRLHRHLHHLPFLFFSFLFSRKESLGSLSTARCLLVITSTSTERIVPRDRPIERARASRLLSLQRYSEQRATTTATTAASNDASRYHRCVVCRHHSGKVRWNVLTRDVLRNGRERNKGIAKKRTPVHPLAHNGEPSAARTTRR